MSKTKDKELPADLPAIDAGTIFEVKDLPREKVNIPEWGGSIYVGTMMGDQRDEWEISLMANKTGNQHDNLRNLRARLAIIVCEDEAGNKLFVPADAERLGKKSASALQRIFNAAKKLNKIGDDDVEELAKN